MLRLFCFGLFATVFATLISAPIAYAQDEEGLSREEILEMFQEAQGFVEDEEWAEASKIFQEIVKADDTIGPAWFQLAYCLHMEGKLDEAIKAHKKAAKFEQFAPTATYNLACAYSLQKKTDLAIETLQKAVKLGFDDPEQIDGDSDMDNIRKDERFVKLLAKLRNGDSDDSGDAEKEEGDSADKKMEDTAKTAEELINEGRQLIAESEFAKASDVLKKATEADKENALAWHLYGYSLHASGKLDDAIEVHKKAAKFKEYAGITMYNLGCAYSLKKDADKAFEALNKAVELNFVRDTAYDDDSDLDNIRKDERFEKLMKTVKEKREKSADHDHDHDHDHEDDDDGK
jgi:Flp pilus assembly protein TadD